jgi:hypothetical protein
MLNLFPLLVLSQRLAYQFKVNMHSSPREVIYNPTQFNSYPNHLIILTSTNSTANIAFWAGSLGQLLTSLRVNNTLLSMMAEG